MPKYQNIMLTNQDFEVMTLLENRIHKKIPLLDQGSHGDHIKSNTFGFIPLNGFINSLGLFNNELLEFPNEIMHLVNIRHLSVSKVNIKNISNNIGSLVNLEKLYVSNNQITKIIEEMYDLSELSVLDLSNNRISEISKSVSKLENLRRLLLNNNGLINIPESISHMKNLQKIDFSHNQIKYLPEAILKVRNLKHLILTGNPFDREWLEQNKDFFSNEIGKNKGKIIW